MPNVSPTAPPICRLSPALTKAEQEPDVRQTGGAAAAKLYRDVLAGVAGGEFGDTLPLGLSRMSTEQEDEAEEFMSGTTSGASSVIESPINVPSAPSPAQAPAVMCRLSSTPQPGRNFPQSVTDLGRGRPTLAGFDRSCTGFGHVGAGFDQIVAVC